MIKFYSLGAAEEVGKSCFVFEMDKKVCMLDCGIHMAFDDQRMFPCFSKYENLVKSVSMIIISHFHLDHIGALPYFVKNYNFKGPIFMTHPTKAILPLLLGDYLRIQKEHSATFNYFNEEDIEFVISLIIPLSLKQLYKYRSISITPYCAGHVIGAAMFYISSKNNSILYSGDYSTVADRHLPGASCPRLKPTVFITESTYAGVVRQSRLERESQLLKLIYETIQQKGKVLIPAFAIGRAQELCTILLQDQKRSKYSKIPVYMSGTLSDKCNYYYQLYKNWCNESFNSFIYNDQSFDFSSILQFNKYMIGDDEPKVVFASPGMLHSGLSLDIFKEWCEDPLNTIIIPGYCVQGTIGAKLIAGEKKIEINKKIYNVRCRVEYISFSAHADILGILELINVVEPENVILVHGNKKQMEDFRSYNSKENPTINIRIANYKESLDF